jgi:hypothetical protein
MVNVMDRMFVGIVYQYTSDKYFYFILLQFSILRELGSCGLPVGIWFSTAASQNIKGTD